jgi:hypothetical protein
MATPLLFPSMPAPIAALLGSAVDRPLSSSSPLRRRDAARPTTAKWGQGRRGRVGEVVRVTVAAEMGLGIGDE